MKRILMRVDLNSPVVNGKIINNERISVVKKIIKKFKSHVLVLMAHQGTKVSLKQHSKLLGVKFVDDLFGPKAVRKIKNMKKGDVLLLENTRFYNEEFNPCKNKFVKNLVHLFDLYVNNAFSVSHRNHTSLVSFPNYLPAIPGEIFINEMNFLSKIKGLKSVYVFGGSKMEEVYLLMKKVLDDGKAVKVLTSGILCLILHGKTEHKLKKSFMKLFNEYNDKIELPVDYAVKFKHARKNVSTETRQKVLDIGDETIRRYKKIIEKSKNVFLKGSAGKYEIKGFEKGTREILKSAMKSNFSFVLGGDTSAAIKLFKLNKNKFSYVSLSGGAALDYLAGKKLPGVEAMRK